MLVPIILKGYAYSMKLDHHFLPPTFAGFDLDYTQLVLFVSLLPNASRPTESP